MRYLPYLLVAAFPLAVAGQNIVAALALIIALAHGARGRCEQFFALLKQPRHALPILLVVWSCGTSLIFNFGGTHVFAGVVRYVLGFLPLLLLPALFAAGLPRSAIDWSKIFFAVVVLAVVWAVIALSQGAVGWRLAGDGLQYGFYRAQALYSHPLTFAYAILLLWPLAITSVRMRVDSWRSWLLLVCVAVCIWLSESRMIQLLALAMLVANTLLYMSRLKKLLVMCILIGLTCFAALGDHPMGVKIRQTISGGGDRVGPYADDRLVFWHAYSQLIADQPLVGHGIDIDKTKVRAAYAAIGMSDFPKQYPAHNSFLQVLAETGVVGLGLFLGWIGVVVAAAWRRRKNDPFATTEACTWVAICLAALSQNAFQDSEVRYGIMLLAIYGALRDAGCDTCQHEK